MAATPFYLQIHATKRFRLLTKKTDSAGNVYVYLKGVASLAAGDAVGYDKDGVTTRTLAATTGHIAIAMSANTAVTTFSWFLVDGYYASANIVTHALGAGKLLCTSASAGRLTAVITTETGVFGAFTTAASVANVGGIFIRNAYAPGDLST